jgi:hypothetical protein
VLSPLTFLAGVLALTLAAYVADLVLRHRGARRLRRLAEERHVRYCGEDRFQITPRVVADFPIPGASDLRVLDLLYYAEGERYRYIFTVEYTLGVIRTKRRLRRCASLGEPRDRASGDGWSPLVLAPDDRSLLEQYRHLCPAGAGTTQ